MKYKELTFIFLACFYSCILTETSDNENVVVGPEFSKLLKEFQSKYIPLKNKVILVELYKNLPVRVYRVKKIDYPYLLGNTSQFFVTSVDSTIVLIQSPFLNDFHFTVDTVHVNRILSSIYSELVNKSEYEVDLRGMHDAWYIIKREYDLEVFNMTDSISVYGSIEDQYYKLNKKIDQDKY